MMQNIVGAFISFYLRYIVAKYSTALKTDIVVGLSTDRCTYLRSWVCDHRAIGTLVSGDPHRWNHVFSSLDPCGCSDKISTQYHVCYVLTEITEVKSSNYIT